jgi:hypothetical protein
MQAIDHGKIVCSIDKMGDWARNIPDSKIAETMRLSFAQNLNIFPDANFKTRFWKGWVRAKAIGCIILNQWIQAANESKYAIFLEPRK